jgi:hypothetical protein
MANDLPPLTLLRCDVLDLTPRSDPGHTRARLERGSAAPLFLELTAGTGDAAAAAAFFRTMGAAQRRVAEALTRARAEALAGAEVSDLRRLVQAEQETLHERARALAEAGACSDALARALGDPDRTLRAEEALAAARANLGRLDERLGLLARRVGPARDRAERALEGHLGAVRAALRAEALAREGEAEQALAEALRPLAGAVAVAMAEVWATGGKGPLDFELSQLPPELVAPRQAPAAPPPAAGPYDFHNDNLTARLEALRVRQPAPPAYVGGTGPLPPTEGLTDRRRPGG